MACCKRKKSNHQADIKNSNDTTLDRNNEAYKDAMDHHSQQKNWSN